MTRTSDQCEWPHCRDDYALIYCGKKVCDLHWSEHLASESKTRAANARVKIGLPRELPKTEWTPAPVDPESLKVMRCAVEGHEGHHTPERLAVDASDEELDGEELDEESDDVPDDVSEDNAEDGVGAILARMRNRGSADYEFE